MKLNLLFGNLLCLSLISGCASDGNFYSGGDYHRNVKSLKQIEEDLLAEGKANFYVEGYIAGCSSGRFTAGNARYRMDRLLRDLQFFQLPAPSK